MDETAIWYDMPGATTVAVKGTYSLPLLTTGHEKQRKTVCLAAMANGCRLKPLIVFKGKRFPYELKGITEAIVKLSSNGWMNEELTLQWMDEVWGTSHEQRILIWDSCRCHTTDPVEDAPTVCRSLFLVAVLPADVSWNAPFKSAYKLHYDSWLARDDRSVTPAGNPRTS